MGLGYIKDPCVPQTLWFLGICPSQNKLQLFKERLSWFRSHVLQKRGWEGLSVLRFADKKRGLFLKEKNRHILPCQVYKCSLARTYHFFLRVFLIAIVKSPPPPFLLGFPFLLLVNLLEILLSLLYSLTPIFTDSNSLISAFNPKFLSF